MNDIDHFEEFLFNVCKFITFVDTHTDEHILHKEVRCQGKLYLISARFVNGNFKEGALSTLDNPKLFYLKDNFEEFIVRLRVNLKEVGVIK